MVDAVANFASSAVATAPSPATSGTSLVVGSGAGGLFPAVPFNAVVCPAGTQPTAANAEIVRVTGKSTDTFTIARGQEGSTARTILVGDQIFAGPTAKTIADLAGFWLNGVTGLWSGSQAAYTALGSYVSTVVYIITP